MNHIAAIVAHNGTTVLEQLIKYVIASVHHALHGSGYRAHCVTTYPRHAAFRIICTAHEIKGMVHPG